MNQSKLQVIICSRRKARENACERVMIGFGFSPDWMKKWRQFLSQSCNVVQNKVFDTRMKATLNKNGFQKVHVVSFENCLLYIDYINNAFKT